MRCIPKQVRDKLWTMGRIWSMRVRGKKKIWQILKICQILEIPATLLTKVPYCLKKVRAEGLEPPCLAAPDPKSGTSTNFATPALPAVALQGEGGSLLSSFSKRTNESETLLRPEGLRRVKKGRKSSAFYQKTKGSI